MVVSKRCAFLVALVLYTLGGARAQWNPNNEASRHVAVHLFEWRWADIAAECERFLGPRLFSGVQVSPPNENIVAWKDVEKRPWWERYQPVSYKLETRSGTEEQFKDMVSRCNAAGVRIYVDAVINHMSGYWGTGTGTGGTYFDSGAKNYPGVPFSGMDFNGKDKCPTASGNIENYGDANQVRNCMLVGLNDLDQGKEYVRGKIVEFMNKCISYGVAGFRIDASKHMWPGDLKIIIDRLSNLPTSHGFPSGASPFIYQEVIDLGGEPITTGQYTGNGRVTEFKYGKFLGEAFRKRTALKHLVNFGEGWGMTASGNAIVFIDNHDNQRGHGAGGDMILTFRVPRLYKMANAFMMAHPYGYTKLMSSYYWDQKWVNGKDENDWVGPPRDSNWNTLPVLINADGTCGNGWVCEHRWRQIFNMVKFRSVVTGTALTNWWDNGNNQIAFCRGDKGFVAFNNEDYGLSQTLQTCLPAGTYCDVISGSLENGACTGKSVVVGSDGKAAITISNMEDDGVLAIHAESRVGSAPPSGTTLAPGPTTTQGPAPEGFQRTVLMIQKTTSVGQDVFVSGGISHEKRPGCTSVASSSACAIDIVHPSTATSSPNYNAWRVGDSHLDWYGAEPGQGTYNSAAAAGSPLIWSTNDASSPSYNSLNTYGPHYWVLDVQMDCSATESGWFEIKGVLNTGLWEYDRTQATCTGTAGGAAPYSSKNHLAKCGKINVFKWDDNSCIINNF